MRTIKASEFKTNCLELMDEVASTGERVVITKRGKPVSLLSPYRGERKSLFGRHKGQIKTLGDIVSPIDEPWDAEG